MKGKILVVGGSSGIGLAAASLMSASGYEVAIASRSLEKLKKAKEVSHAKEIYPLDILREEEVAHFFSSFTPFDHLVISAADFIMGPFLTLETSEARRFFDSKFWGQYLVAKYGAPKLKKGGSITFFSGVASQKPIAGLSVASAINGAVESLTRALAVELSPIRVNAIAPGTIITPVWDSMPKAEREAYFEKEGKSLPTGRVGKPEDIAKVVHFLIECGYITGEVIYCDGGKKLSG